MHALEPPFRSRLSGPTGRMRAGKEDMRFIDEVKFDENGLIPAVVQDAGTREVLMVAYMNREALRKTMETGASHFWSRSRQKLWLKGESSGHTQTVRDIRMDCDADALLILVDQNVAACHTGYFTCFYRESTADGGIKEIGEKVFDPGDVYGQGAG